MTILYKAATPVSIRGTGENSSEHHPETVREYNKENRVPANPYAIRDTPYKESSSNVKRVTQRSRNTFLCTLF